MGKAIISIILMNIFILGSGKILGQSRKNFIGWIADGSYGLLSSGLSYERSIGNRISIAINCSGIIGGYPGFKANIEPRYYFKKKSDSTSRCKGWYLGFKPWYMYEYEKGYSSMGFNSVTNQPITYVTSTSYWSSVALFITFGKQWVLKNGIFFNAGIGAGPDTQFISSNGKTIRDTVDHSNVFSYITFDAGVKVGYSF